MLTKTKLIKQKLSKVNNNKDKISLLKNYYTNDECVIITGGPSLSEINKEKIINFSKDKLVIAIKQTASLVDYNFDFHLINEFNYSLDDKIDTDGIKIKIAIESSNFKTPNYNEDILLNISRNKLDFNESLAIKKNFNDYLIEESQYRPLGPGIMHELGIYLPLLLGCKKVYVLGWDIGSISTDKIVRFYDNKSYYKSLTYFIYKLSPIFHNLFLIRFENLIRYFIFYTKINRNILMNNPGIRKSESIKIAQSTEDLFDFYNDKGLELLICSKKSLVSNKFKRFEII